MGEIKLSYAAFRQSSIVFWLKTIGKNNEIVNDLLNMHVFFQWSTMKVLKK